MKRETQLGSQARAALRHARDPWPAQAPTEYRRHHAADLRYLDLRATKPRVHKGLDTAARTIRPRWAFERCIADPRKRRASVRVRLGHGRDRDHPSARMVRRRRTRRRSDDLLRNLSPVRARAQAQRRNPLHVVDMSDVENVRAAIRPETRVLWVESPSNPLLKIADLTALGAAARQHDLMAVGQHVRQPVGAAAALNSVSTCRALDHQVL